MPLHKDDGIVLSKRAYGESDRIVRIFTLTSGKIGAIAKGASKSQKRFMNTLEPFNHIAIEYFEKYGKGMVRIENAHVVEANAGIEKTLKKVCTASFFTEFVDRLTKEREKNTSLFYLLKEVLTRIKDVEFDYHNILSYELDMLECLGYMPNFSACVYCGKTMMNEDRLYFSSERGGILCPRCSRFIPHKAYPGEVIATLAGLKNGHPRPVPAIDGEETGDRPIAPHGAGNGVFEKNAREIMEGFVSFHLDVEFKSYRVLKSLFQF
ncbi:MAG: DNA repair protein RecO [Syntrophorhabdus sp. PtaU1.Bin153]|nr:MAG: DNA repair protein RecO [Syntrophorhabdus sp. PtaU1.Bin153]